MTERDPASGRRRPSGRKDDSPQRDYENPEAGVYPALLVGALLLLTAGLLSLMLYTYARRQQREAARLDGAPVSRELTGPPPSPPPPRQQIDPAADLRAMVTSQTARLSSYGWVDRQAGIARIPIDRALRLTAGSGLPARPAPGAEEETVKAETTAAATAASLSRDSGLYLPSDSSSGRAWIRMLP